MSTKSTIIYLGDGTHIYHNHHDGNTDRAGNHRPRIELQIPIDSFRNINIDREDITIIIYEKNSPQLYRLLNDINDISRIVT